MPDPSQDLTLAITMPRGGWDAVLRALEAAADDEEDDAEQVRLQDALLLYEDALEELEEVSADGDPASTH